MDEKKLTVNVQIGGITLPMTVANSEQEEIIRKAASNVNQQIMAVREKYKNVPNEKYYEAMVMLNAETKALNAEAKSNAEPIFDVLKELENEIDELIKK